MAGGTGYPIQILTNDFEGRDQRLISKEDALTRIEEIRISPASRDLSKVLIRQNQGLQTGKQENRTAFLLSDFQTNIADLNDYDGPARVYALTCSPAGDLLDENT